MSLPLDDDGFLRRECPNCERELKWRPTRQGENEVPVSESGYVCPYCAKAAEAGQWWTNAQAEYISGLIGSQVVGPELKGLERHSDPNALFSFEVHVNTPPPPADLPPEPNDMRRVDFECHPTEPVKVDADWQDDVHCIICGTAAPQFG